MDTIENWISSLLDKPVRLILPGLALIAVVAAWRMVQSRSLDVIKNKYTYILVNRNGFSRTLDQSAFLWDLREWVLKGKAAPDWSFSSYSEEEGKLLDRKTGKVDLRIQTLICNFEASSADLHNLTGNVEVLFRLDKDQIKNTLNIAAFGSVLKNRVLSALREELGRATDDKIRKNLKEIQDEALKKLSETSKPDNSDGAAHKESGTGNLGIIFLELTCHIHESSNTERKQSTKEQSQGAASTAMSPTAMNFSAVEISRIRKEFLGGLDAQGEVLQAANDAVLQILEMHTRQRIAEALVKSGSLVVLSADDLGISGNNLFREKMRLMLNGIASGAHASSKNSGANGKDATPAK